MTFKIQRRQLTAVVAAALALGATASFAQASDKPLRMVLPVGAGSGVDTIMRAATPSLTKALGGQAVVIENLPGAGGITGTGVVVRAAADGQTLGVVSNNHVVNPSVFKKMPFDAINDITPISVVGATPFVLVVNPKLPAKNARELQALLKAKPDGYNYASSGNGTIIHLAGAMFVDAAGVEVRHIPYKGVGPMVADLIGGQVEMGVVAVPAVQGQLKSGALRAIGVMGKTRVPSLPDVPTIAEQGFPDVDVSGWFAVIGPAKLPPAEVKRLHAAIVAAFNMPETRDAMAKQENIINPMTPEASAQFFKAEQERYARLVKKANIVAE
ncbi:tripartite tricarboxylate transporter substrate binding protein [Variovorax ginsengisoli]|uniref:Tripartite tricarboxylate transporter substrate binding protein n=1 Tax=Variovorax ginsengisoli TaxID=363844 RepID=A0ABT8S1Q2_9BURK|nr:tripartite tricarboxylate transporter substrate binding protein [Variovorax ginsengisoli]MDN8613689.1 tripartite tricarboxylate transporter substrate binding protein [Variovorax ginsengisoli]MDO1532859.1 tripartite tricarboxylate transporter substrate binding protein [Variovorax ginsengisoli]